MEPFPEAASWEPFPEAASLENLSLATVSPSFAPFEAKRKSTEALMKSLSESSALMWIFFPTRFVSSSWVSSVASRSTSAKRDSVRS